MFLGYLNNTLTDIQINEIRTKWFKYVVINSDLPMSKFKDIVQEEFTKV